MSIDTIQTLISVPVGTFLLIFFAEFGDKSQLVCMTLAARHPHRPVMIGAVAAFALLNLLAVLFGSLLAQWIPETLISALVALLFGLFGVQALLVTEEDEEAAVEAPDQRSILLTVLLMIFVAELGDKTQLAVAGLSTQYSMLVVWFASTLALSATSALGIFAGKKVLARFPIRYVHRASGIFFLSVAAVATFNLSQLMLA